MGEPYLTVGEFTRTMEALRTQIAIGFSETHRRQDTTNGRVLRVEKTVEVLSSARLIDRTDALESQVQQLESDADHNADRAKDAAKVSQERRTTLRSETVRFVLTVLSALLVLWLGARFGWKH